uniref:Serine/threonine-protein phosphatase 2A regulatory subunit B'' subunit gamma n=1 Tax=Globodera rostochiensis TaxID=31243 RepID=A0A914I5Q5_GLORO
MYSHTTSLIKLNAQERLNLQKYKKFVKDFHSQWLRLPQSASKSRKELVPESIRRECLKMILDREASKLPSDEVFNDFVDCLEASEHVKLEEVEGKTLKTISFNGLMSVLGRVGKSVTNLLLPTTFFRAHFPEWDFQSECRIQVDVVVEFVSLKMEFVRYRIKMALYDPDSTGYLTREQFCNYYLKEVMPMVDVLKDLEETFQICYMNTVESMFFFFLDPKHTGRIRISDALVSGFLENAFSLQRNSENYDNWFSPEKTHEQNAIFQMLDSKRKNFLNRDDFKKHLDRAITQTFVDRLYEIHIAYNHLVHPASMAYFFKVLDVAENELCSCYNEWVAVDGAMPAFDDFCDQFFDMVKPTEDGRISLQELLDCKQGHDFILCLINYQEFYRYEMRDSESNAGLDQDSAVPLFGDMSDDETDEQESVPSTSELVKKIVDECNNNVNTSI